MPEGTELSQIIILLNFVGVLVCESVNTAERGRDSSSLFPAKLGRLRFATNSQEAAKRCRFWRPPDSGDRPAQGLPGTFPLHVHGISADVPKRGIASTREKCLHFFRTTFPKRERGQSRFVIELGPSFLCRAALFSYHSKISHKTRARSRLCVRWYPCIADAQSAVRGALNAPESRSTGQCGQSKKGSRKKFPLPLS